MSLSYIDKLRKQFVQKSSKNLVKRTEIGSVIWYNLSLIVENKNAPYHYDDSIYMDTKSRTWNKIHLLL